ncbi:uncharacterized protein FPRO_10216 [Fusarium proliferatum ET1]|uniref:Uncharacterized protein n=1 Tax=Fusarium proliferatum (strain ET1) TaxID=1227346 RepID=A0A1L7VL75_FUSPR|nr:uncharacterized protein FPRO_10216 [Fusarium proliferatum ET1]CZR40626.1 uncharacterized protein FPRO_10216 [Fusarium proliferatum ET1]
MPAEFYSRFLVHRFAMIDVIMSLLRRRKPIAPAPFILYQQHEEADIHGPPFRELTDCPQSVLSFLVKISILASDAELENDDRFAGAYQLETTMRDSPCLSETSSQDDHLSTLNAYFY